MQPNNWQPINNEVNIHLTQQQKTLPINHAVVEEMELYATTLNFPILERPCAMLCYQMARIIKATSIFEMGSGFGYSTLFFAQAVKENGGGMVHHVVWNDELSQKAQCYAEQLGLNKYIQFHVAEAVATLQQQTQTFDLIFNDIDKYMYPSSLPVIEQKLRSGGLLIVDNMLWHGRIFNEADQAISTQGVRTMNNLLHNNSRWITSLFPVRDGLTISYKQ